MIEDARDTPAWGAAIDALARRILGSAHRPLRLREHEAADDPGILEHGGMRLDIRTRRVEVDGRIQELTNREYSLLEMLLRNKGETISREQLLESVWGMDFDPGSNIVNVYIRSLRRKIGENKVQTVRGVGYRVE